MTYSMDSALPGLRCQEHKLRLTIGQMLCWGVNDGSKRRDCLDKTDQNRYLDA